jgi:hypothetical protein
MRSIFAALAMAGSMAFPVLAQDAMSADVTCEDFVAMDEAGQMEAMSGMGEGAMAARAMAPADAMAPEPSATAVADVCEDHPDMMLGEAIEGAMGD